MRQKFDRSNINFCEIHVSHPARSWQRYQGKTVHKKSCVAGDRRIPCIKHLLVPGNLTVLHLPGPGKSLCSKHDYLRLRKSGKVLSHNGYIGPIVRHVPTACDCSWDWYSDWLRPLLTSRAAGHVADTGGGGGVGVITPPL